MASGRLEGIYRLYIESPTGQRKLVKSASEAWWNCSNLGSADGVISTTATPEKWNFLPASSVMGGPGYSIVLTVELTVSDGSDISDSVGIIPVVVNGQVETIGIPGGNGLGNFNFTTDVTGADLAASTPTGLEITVFKVRAKEGVNFRVGGDRVFLSLEDDTA